MLVMDRKTAMMVKVLPKKVLLSLLSTIALVSLAFLRIQH